MEIVLEQKDAADWVYRGEGAANLVLAYTGSSSEFVGKVMRIPKSPTNGSRCRSPSALSRQECLLWRGAEFSPSTDKNIASQLYVQHVMSPLLGSKHVDAGIRVLVAREFLESVQKSFMSQRPPWRVDSGKIDAYCHYGLLISDHSIFPDGTSGGVPCISVEIKPKCGFLPVSRFIAECNSIKQRVTRFRMHQALKLHQGEISEISDYDPLDLFSGSRTRLCKAIEDLFSTPQNNFRVFLNGSLLFGALGGGAEQTDFATKEAFEDALKPIILTKDGTRTMSFIHLLVEALHQSGVLNRLLKVQKLDSLDIEGAIHAYYNVISEPCIACSQCGEGKIPHVFTSMHSISFDRSLKIVKDFLIAATAKDCSLMIGFRPSKVAGSCSSYESIYLESSGQYFEYKVHFIDLDLKPLKKMEEYYELDRKIVSCYTEMLAAGGKG